MVSHAEISPAEEVGCLPSEVSLGGRGEISPHRRKGRWCGAVATPPALTIGELENPL